jgi:hypothetical protein
MSTLSTTSLNWLASEWEKVYKTAVLSGIVGDLAHKARGGYHISREDQPSTNYSVTRADDKSGNGPSDRAAAIDMTMSTADIIKCHTRIRELWKNRAKDSRFKYINAWNGWDGQGDAGRYDVVKGTITTASSDHKWHIHLEIRRKYVNDMTAMKAVLSILKGEPAPGVVATSPSSSSNGDDDMTKAEFLAFLASAEGKVALANAVWNTDGVIAAPGSPKPGKNADGTDVNTHWAGASYLQNTYASAVSARGYSAQAASALSKDVNVDEVAIANALLGNSDFINGFAASVAAKLPPTVQASPSQLADAFKTALREGVANA